MKWLLLASLFLSGCITPIPYTYEERCAYRGMKVSGVDLNNGSSSGYIYGRGPVAFSNSGENIRCDQPASSSESAEVAKYQRSISPKIDFNNSVGLKNISLGIGYLYYIIPGAGLYYWYDQQKSEAIDESNRAGQ